MHADAVTMRRKGDALVAADDDAAKMIGRVKDGALVEVRVIRGRSAQQNRLYRKVLQCVVDSTGFRRTANELHEALKIETGQVDIVEKFDGRRVKVTKSAAFDAMSQDAFQAYMDAAFQIICDEIMGGMPIEQLLEEAEAA